MDIRERVIQHIRSHTLMHHVASFAMLILTLMLILLFGKIFLSRHEVTELALANGQRVIYHVGNGKIDGVIRHTQRFVEHKEVDTSQIISKEGLAPAPMANLIEPSDKGMIPTRHENTVPWRYYARPHQPPMDKPSVAIIITNVGLSKPLSEEVLKLPHDFTLAFSPYAGDAANWARRARQEGFESLVVLPMEPENYPFTDPGPYGLLEELSATESSARLHWILSRFPGYVGVIAPGNEKLTANVNAIRPTAVELTARGILMLYMKTPKNAALADLAKSRGLTAIGIDLSLDDEITTAAIEAQLAALTELAKKQGSAIAVAHSYPPTLEALSNWIDALPSSGVELTPVSTIAAQRMP